MWATVWRMVVIQWTLIFAVGLFQLDLDETCNFPR